LWASLTAQSILRGIKSGDDKALLEKRLLDLPAGMDAL
jgi:hypothetical protein